MSETAKWACPKCGADAGDCSGAKKPCTALRAAGCQGLICECESEDDNSPINAEDHGVSPTNKCRNAKCYHCQWRGTLPKAKKKEMTCPTCKGLGVVKKTPKKGF